jgi:hypothetical protein
VFTTTMLQPKQLLTDSFWQHGDCASSTLCDVAPSDFFFVSTDEEKAERKAIPWCGWSQR